MSLEEFIFAEENETVTYCYKTSTKIENFNIAVPFFNSKKTDLYIL